MLKKQFHCPHFCNILFLISHSKDMYGNTPLHYAKPYPDQSIVLYLLSHGAKLDVNNRKVVNLNENTLEKYFFENTFVFITKIKSCQKIEFFLEFDIGGIKPRFYTFECRVNCFEHPMVLQSCLIHPIFWTKYKLLWTLKMFVMWFCLATG